VKRWGGIFALWVVGTIVINYVVPGFAYWSGRLVIPALIVYLVVFGRYGLIAKYRKHRSQEQGGIAHPVSNAPKEPN